MPSPKPAADFVVDLLHGPGGTFEVRAEWRGSSVQEPLSVDIEEAVRGLREGAAAHAAAREARRVVSAPVSTFRASEVGGRLFAALFKDSVRELLGASRAIAKAEGRVWRLCLRFQADELARVPWELLYDKGLRSFLAHRHPVVRLPWTGRRALAAPPVKERRILWAGASPDDMGKLDLEREWRCLDRALRSVREADRPEVSRLEPATPEALLRALRGDRYQILHFAGHGAFEGEEGALVLCGPEGHAHRLGAVAVAAAIADRGSLGAVVLNACEGATGSADDARTSVAALLATHGVPAIVAMQTPIRDDFAAALTEHLYSGLAAGKSIEEAMVEARKDLLARDELGAELGAWASPVLWMQYAEDAPKAAAAVAAGTPGASLLPWILPVVLWPRETVSASEPERESKPPERPPEPKPLAPKPPAEPKVSTGPAPPPPPPGSKLAALLAAVAIGGALAGGVGYMKYCTESPPPGIVASGDTTGTTTSGSGTTTTTSGTTTSETDTTTTSSDTTSESGTSTTTSTSTTTTSTTTTSTTTTSTTTTSTEAEPAPGPPLNSLTLMLAGAKLLGDEEKMPGFLKPAGRAADRAERCKGVTYCVEPMDRVYFPLPKNGLQLVKKGTPNPRPGSLAWLYVNEIPVSMIKELRVWKHKPGSVDFKLCKIQRTCNPQGNEAARRQLCTIQVIACLDSGIKVPGSVIPQ